MSGATKTFEPFKDDARQFQMGLFDDVSGFDEVMDVEESCGSESCEVDFS